MAISKQELQALLLESFPNAELHIDDLVGDEDHYSLKIKDKAFNGLALIKQHKMVKDSLQGVLGTKLHALTIKTIPA